MHHRATPQKHRAHARTQRGLTQRRRSGGVACAGNVPAHRACCGGCLFLYRSYINGGANVRARAFVCAPPCSIIIIIIITTTTCLSYAWTHASFLPPPIDDHIKPGNRRRSSAFLRPREPSWALGTILLSRSRVPPPFSCVVCVCGACVICFSAAIKSSRAGSKQAT